MTTTDQLYSGMGTAVTAGTAGNSSIPIPNINIDIDLLDD
jgi:hypothetical protein